MESSTQQCQSFMPSMPASYRFYFDQSSFHPATLAMTARHADPTPLPNANGRPPFPDLGLPRQEWRAITEASPDRTQLEEVSIVAPRRGSPPRLHDFIARMEESLSSDLSWVDEAPTPPTSPPPPSPETIILGSPNASWLVENANGFATSAPKRRKIEIEREDVGPHVPSSSPPVLTLYDELVQMRQARVNAQAQHVDRANRFVSCGANPQEIQPEMAAPRPHNHRHPSPPPPPAQAPDLTRANVVPWFAAQGVELRPEEAQVLDDFLARRYESAPSPAPESRRITVASTLAERQNPLLEPLRSRLFLLEQAGLGDMDFDGGLATEVMAMWPCWED